ncbi:iron uptake porin [Lyngbya aestuarii]|uniref:iron uptake porin n=1 Tax=Lyngbya aestuarii TaxID=118322 RepID=UPI00403D79B4
MSKFFWNTLKVSPALLGAIFAASSAYATPSVSDQKAVTVENTTEPSVKLPENTVLEEDFVSQSNQPQNNAGFDLAQQMPVVDSTDGNANSEVLEQIELYNSNEINGDPLGQVTNINQLRDVSPGDWAYEALRSLVERYNCIVGYPDGTYRGQSPTTRYEFAAGLNSCLDQIVRIIEQQGGGVSREDLETLQRLVQEFEAELATLGTRVDNLEGRVSFLEDHQFSTTTKLNGEVIFSVASAFGEDTKVDGSGEDVDDNVTLSNRVRLNLDSSFTGKDRLRVRLESGNITRFDRATGTDMARLGYDANNGNDIEINDLIYRTPVGDNLRFWIGASGFEFEDMADVYNPLLESSGTGALSRFNRRNPAVYRNGSDMGAGLNIKFSDSLGLDVAYLTSSNGSDPSDKNGLFDGTYTALAQLNLGLGEALGLGLTYAYSYYPGGEVDFSGSVGSPLAEDPFDGVAASAHRFGVQGDLKLGSKVSLGGWGGLVLAEAEAGAREGDNADIWNWEARVAFSDFGKEGAVLAFAGGQPPKATNVDGGPEDEDTSYLVEALYKFPITDNILLTPGAYVIFNPNHDDGNDEIWVGVLRTTFKF